MDGKGFVQFFLEVVDLMAPGVLEIRIKERLNYIDVCFGEVDCFALFVNCAGSSNIRVEIFPSYFASNWSQLKIESCTLRMWLDNRCVDKRFVAFVYEMLKFAPSKGLIDSCKVSELRRLNDHYADLLGLFDEE